MASPIETNTEGLQEILQTVYNLPNAGSSGSSEADLIIGLTMPSGKALTPDYMADIGNSLFVKSGTIADTYEKLVNKQEVKVVLEHDYYYGAFGPFVGVFNPVIVTTFPSGSAVFLYLEFVVTGSVGYSHWRFGIVYDMGGSIMDMFLEPVAG